MYLGAENLVSPNLSYTVKINNNKNEPSGISELRLYSLENSTVPADYITLY